MSSATQGIPVRGLVVVNVAHRIAAVIQQAVDRDEYEYSVIYIIHTAKEELRVTIHHEDAQITHVYDIQTMLDMRSGYEQYVREKTLTMMRSLLT